MPYLFTPDIFLKENKTLGVLLMPYSLTPEIGLEHFHAHFCSVTYICSHKQYGLVHNFKCL